MDGWVGAARLAMVAAATALVGCSTRAVDLRSVDSVVVPEFAPAPDEPGASPQLAALRERDRSGLVPDDAADGSLLAPALDALAERLPAAAQATRISVYDDDVHFGLVDPTNPNRAISVTYYGPSEMYVSEPQVLTDEAFSFEGIDPNVPGQVADAIARQYPSLRVRAMDLRPGTSYGFGLVWNLDVEDARGSVATVFVDLDGTVIAVDLDLS